MGALLFIVTWDIDDDGVGVVGKGDSKMDGLMFSPETLFGGGTEAGCG